MSPVRYIGMNTTQAKPFMYLLQQGIESQFSQSGWQHYVKPEYNVDLILRSESTLLPLGAFVLANSVPKNPLPGWGQLQGELIDCVIYIVNFKRFITTGEVEMVEWEPGVKFAPIILPEASGALSEAAQTVTFEVSLTPWSKGNLVRYYVNGNGYGADKMKNFLSIFENEPAQTPKVYVQDGQIKCFPGAPIKEEAKAFILSQVPS